MALDIWPKPNLPGAATPWGREVQTRIIQLDRALDSVQSQSVNGDRAVSGNLEYVASRLLSLQEQTEDLASRKTIRQDLDDMTVSTTFTAGSNGRDITTSQSVLVTPPNTRAGDVLVTFSGSFDVTNAATSASPALMRLDYQGQMIAPIPVAAGAGPSRPAYSDGGNWSTSIFVPGGGNPIPFTVTVTSFVNRWDGTAGSAGIVASNLAITMTFG